MVMHAPSDQIMMNFVSKIAPYKHKSISLAAGAQRDNEDTAPQNTLQKDKEQNDRFIDQQEKHSSFKNDQEYFEMKECKLADTKAIENWVKKPKQELE